jgi:L-asparaginase
MGLYETGIQLLQAGVVSGRDMTIEAVITKLMVLFGRGCSADEVRRLMGCSLAGEISVGDNCAVLS